MNKKIVFIAVALMVFIFGFSLFNYFDNKKYGAISITVIPGDSKITVDDEQKTRRQGTIRLLPGEHKLTISRSGFENTVIDITIEKGKTLAQELALEANSQEGLKWLRDHPDQAIKAEGISSRNYERSTKEIIKQNPIISILPFIDREYRIDYGQSVKTPDDKSAVAVYITFYTLNGKNQALEWLKFKGYDPEKLEIVYREKSGF